MLTPHPFVAHASVGVVREPALPMLVACYGSGPSTALLDPAFHPVAYRGLAGVLGAARAHGAVVTVGDPLGAESERVALAAAFTIEQREAEHVVALVAVSTPIAEWAAARGMAVIEIARELRWARPSDLERGEIDAGAELVAARHHGVCIRPFDEVATCASPEAIAYELDVLLGRARDAGTSSRSFGCALAPRAYPDLRSCLLATAGDALVGAATLTPVAGAWVLDELAEDPNAPRGTLVALLDAAVRHAARHGRELSFGTCPLAGIGHAQHLSGVERLAIDGLARVGHAWRPDRLALGRALGPRSDRALHLAVEPASLRLVASLVHAVQSAGAL